MRRQAQISILEIFNIFLLLKFSPSLPDEKMSHSAKVSFGLLDLAPLRLSLPATLRLRGGRA